MDGLLYGIPHPDCYMLLHVDVATLEKLKSVCQPGSVVTYHGCHTMHVSLLNYLFAFSFVINFNKSPLCLLLVSVVYG